LTGFLLVGLGADYFSHPFPVFGYADIFLLAKATYFPVLTLSSVMETAYDILSAPAVTAKPRRQGRAAGLAGPICGRQVGQSDFWFISWFINMVYQKPQGLPVLPRKPLILLEPAEGIEPTAC